MIEKKCNPKTYDRLVIPKNTIKNCKRQLDNDRKKLFPAYIFVKSEDIEAFAEELKKDKTIGNQLIADGVSTEKVQNALK